MRLLGFTPPRAGGIGYNTRSSRSGSEAMIEAINRVARRYSNKKKRQYALDPAPGRPSVLGSLGESKHGETTTRLTS